MSRFKKLPAWVDDPKIKKEFFGFLLPSKGHRIFTGPRKTDGFGDFRGLMAQRVAWYYERGNSEHPITATCGARLCCEVSHLAEGNRRGSQAGANNSGAKLTAEQVVEIRRAYFEPIEMRIRTQRDLAEEYGVTPMTISNIIRGKTWV